MELLKILGEIDDKFYDEALGGDTEKPLKIDVSRAPVKWYRIAAPIAACLVLGVGVFTLSRYLNYTGVVPPVNSEGDPASSAYTSAAEADIDACRQILAENNYDVSDCSTRIMDINFDGVDEVVMCPDGGKGGVHIFAKYEGEMIGAGFIDTEPYRYCLTDLNSLKEYDPSEHLEGGGKYWYFHFAEENTEAHVLAEAVARITHGGASSYGIDFPVAAYTTAYSDTGTDDLFLEKDWSYAYNFDRSSDAENTGIEISRNEFASIWEKHFPIEELNEGFVLALNAGDPFKKGVNDLFPLIDYPTIMFGDEFDPSVIEKIGRFKDIVVSRKHDSIRNEEITYAALVGEDIYRHSDAIGDAVDIRMSRMSVILFKGNTLEAQLPVDELFAGYDTGSGYGKIVLYNSDFALKYYQLEDCGIFIINNNVFDHSKGDVGGFAALTKEGKLILLKGIYESVYQTVYNTGTLTNIMVSGNSLIDTANGVEYHFFPERFENAEPDAEHPHFTTVQQYTIPNEVKGGKVYDIYDTDRPTNVQLNWTDNGTQEDLERWKEFVRNAKPAVIEAVASVGYTHSLSDRKANAILEVIRNAHLEIYTMPVNPPMGGGDGYKNFGEPEVFAYDSDGNILFSVYYNGQWVDVTFEGKAYRFDGLNGGINSIDDYLD